MFVDRQFIFRQIWSLILVTLSQEILRFRAANIDKIKKTTTFFQKKVFFKVIFCQFSSLRHSNFGGKGSTTAAAVVAQTHEPAYQFKAQEDIVGSLEMVNHTRAEHEGTHAVIG